jgi:phage gp36-like protein
MSYSTDADLALRATPQDLIQLTDVESEGAANAAVIAAARAEAHGWINSRVACRRAVPVDPTPDLLKWMEVRETLYNLHRDRHSVTEDLRKQHEADDQWLDDYAAGKVGLGDDADPNAPGTVQHSADDRVFTRDDMKGW